MEGNYLSVNFVTTLLPIKAHWILTKRPNMKAFLFSVTCAIKNSIGEVVWRHTGLPNTANNFMHVTNVNIVHQHQEALPCTSKSNMRRWNLSANNAEAKFIICETTKSGSMLNHLKSCQPVRFLWSRMGSDSIGRIKGNKCILFLFFTLRHTKDFSPFRKHSSHTPGRCNRPG